MADVMICAQSAQVLVDDGDRLEWVRADRTTAHADHPVVVEYPHLWRRLEINYPSLGPVTDDQPPAQAEPADPGDDDADAASAPAAPAARDVRAWAKAEGIDVPARGPIPDDVVDRYRDAQG